MTYRRLPLRPRSPCSPRSCCSPPATRPLRLRRRRPPSASATVNGKPMPKSEFDLYVANLEAPVGPRAHRGRPQPSCSTSTSACSSPPKRPRRPASTRTRRCATSWRWRGSSACVDAGLQKYLESHPCTESDLRPEYDAQVAALPREYHARHILVDDKTVAEAITKELKGGADFAKLAAKRSKDSPSKNGGDLGWFTLDTHGQAVRRRRARLMTAGPAHRTAGAKPVRLARDQARRIARDQRAAASTK